MKATEIYDVRIIYMETDMSNGEELAFVSWEHGVYRTKKSAIKKAREVMENKISKIKSLDGIKPKFDLDKMTDEQLFKENYIEGDWFTQYYVTNDEDRVSVEYYVYINVLEFYDE